MPVEGQGRAVDHDGAEARIDRGGEFIQRVGVVEVQRDLRGRCLGDGLDDERGDIHAANERQSGAVELDQHWSPSGFGGPDDAADHLNRGHVGSDNGATSRMGLFDDWTRVDQRHEGSFPQVCGGRLLVSLGSSDI